MAISSQRTTLYFIDPSNDSVQVVGCPTNIDGIDTTIGQNETTCLGDSARTYIAGLGTPGAATFTIQFDPADASHVRLHQLKTAGTTLQWAIGMSDGTAPPTVHVDSHGDGDFVLPSTRSWITFEGFMTSYPFTFAIDTPVTSSIGIQVSGDPVLTVKTP
jgi:hypothetical protein